MPAVAQTASAPADPIAVQASQAEELLRQCRLEQSLAIWREILKVDPKNERANFVVTQLTAAALDLDSHLDVITTMADKGLTADAQAMLTAAISRAATDEQKARTLYLRGRLARMGDCEGNSEMHFRAAVKLYGDTAWGGRAAIALAEAPWSEANIEDNTRLLRGVIDSPKMNAVVKEEALATMLEGESQQWTAPHKMAALDALLAKVQDAKVKYRLLSLKIEWLGAGPEEQKWSPEALDAAGAILALDLPREIIDETLYQLSQAVDSQDPATLDRLLAVMASWKPARPELARQTGWTRTNALISRAVVETNIDGVRKFLAGADEAMKPLAAEALPGDSKRLWELRGRRLLVEAQKLAAMRGPSEALPAIAAAKEYYIAGLPTDPEGCVARLTKIGLLLEHVREWEVAAGMYREIARKFPHLEQGRDSLLRLAQIYDSRLDAPMEALAVYAEYAARYPADLSYRQLNVGVRLQRLGYANVLDFQKRMGLKPDGVFGPGTKEKLEETESSFDAISTSQPAQDRILRGQFVHGTMLAIADRLRKAGRDHDAIQAYLLVLNLFPTKKEADDCLLAVARLLRDNMLFEEALGAYREMIEYFPKGDKTSEAYVESAACLENLGRWDQAKELYELYVKKFPQYKHVELCKQRMAVLDELRQYQEFLAGYGDSPKAAEAQYEIGSILYKELKNNTKAAVEFEAVAAKYPKHVRAPEGLFTAGTAYLRVENFPAARKVFEKLVTDYPDSRLADDGQFWIGHTYEYAARALGKLDDNHVVLKRRNLQQRAALLADAALRHRFFPAAPQGAELPEDVWTVDALGVLTSGSNRDRVNADLFKAIAEYRKVAEKFKMGDMAGEALYRVAVIYTEYLKDDEKGFKAYEELLVNYPGAKVAGSALYEVGGHYLKNKQYEEAAKAYRQFVFNYPNDARVEDAMLAVARVFMEQKTWDKALDAYESYLNKFPDGKHAAFAKAQIDWIRTYHY